MQTLLAILLVLGGASLLLTALTHATILRAARRTPRATALPPISILKPLKGVDDGLYENLVSLAQQDYPVFELLLGCEDPRDPALVMAFRLMREFPQVPIRVVAGATAAGLNPKVNNLRMLSACADFDCVLISDASVRARPDYLRAMASEFSQPNVGLVSSVLVGSGERSLGARLDNLHMNSFVVRAVCGASELTSRPCVVGKSMLFRLSELTRLGGFSSVDNVLAEDYVLGEQFSAAGKRVALCSQPLASVSVHRTVRDFFSRHVRWSQMRRRLSPFTYPFEPLQSPLPFLIFAWLPLAAGAAPSVAGSLALALAGGIAARLWSDAVIARKLRGTPLSLADYAAIPLKDALCLGIWAAGAVKRTVNWRGTTMLIGPGSRLYPLEQEHTQGRRQALENA